jgi:putative ABC transport system permease protein
MLSNYFRIGWRSLFKNKLFSIINILGLSIGVAAFLLIRQYVSYERSYEQYIPNAQNVFRVQLDVYQNDELEYRSSENYAGVGPALQEELPDVLSYAKLYNMGSKNNIVVTRSDQAEPIVIKQGRLLYSTEGFLPMFHYMIKAGDAEQMDQPFKMAISATTAKKYFGSEQAIGNYLRLEDDDFNDELCEVVAVFEDSPDNTHLKVDILVSFATLYARGEWAPGRYGTGWGRKDYYTYVELREGASPIAVENKMTELVSKYASDHLDRGQKDVLSLQPVRDIHLFSKLTDEPEVHGNGDGLYYLVWISYFILIIAWVNYINLSTARAVDRGREVGLRKVLGSHRRPLIWQFLIESFVINGLSMVLVFIAILISTPFFRALGGTPESYVIWQQAWFWLTVFAILFVGSILSGLYPAFVLSSFKPTAVLHGKLKSSNSGLFLRKGLVVFQFATSVAMIIGTWAVYNQMEYMQSKDLGLSIDQTLVIERPSKRDTSYQQVLRSLANFKTELSQENDIEYVAGGTMLPGKKLRFRSPVQIKNSPNQNEVICAAAWVDYEFADAMGFEVVAGRLFSQSFNDYEDEVVVLTEKAARGFGYDSPEQVIGKTIIVEDFRNYEAEVIGIIKDFHQESLKEAQMPIMIGTGPFMMEYYMIKVSTSNLQTTLDKISSQWYESFPGNPFDYFFLDEYFNSYYETDRRFSNMFAVFAVFAVFIGCLGLFGLSSFTAMQRTKEIAIRKVLGSTLLSIVLMLSREFLQLIFIAILIAWPLVYIGMEEWLSNYPYRSELQWWYE